MSFMTDEELDEQIELYQELEENEKNSSEKPASNVGKLIDQERALKHVRQRITEIYGNINNDGFVTMDRKAAEVLSAVETVLRLEETINENEISVPKKYILVRFSHRHVSNLGCFDTCKEAEKAMAENVEETLLESEAETVKSVNKDKPICGIEKMKAWADTDHANYDWQIFEVPYTN